MSITIYRHTLENEQWYTDSPNPTDTKARKFAPYMDEAGFWLEVRGGQFITGTKYEYWPSENLLVEIKER